MFHFRYFVIETIEFSRFELSSQKVSFVDLLLCIAWCFTRTDINL